MTESDLFHTVLALLLLADVIAILIWAWRHT
jgi:hypothetical protein